MVVGAGAALCVAVVSRVLVGVVVIVVVMMVAWAGGWEAR